MVERPTSITVIGWLIFILGIVGAMGVTVTLLQQRSPAVQEAMASNPLPVPAQYAMMIVGTGVQLTSGYFILSGKNWSRFLYVAWSVLGLCIGVMTTPAKIFLLPSVVMFVVITFFLYRPAANAFFAADGVRVDPRSIPSTSQIASIVFYILAAFFLACTGTLALMTAPAPVMKPLMLGFFVAPFAVCLAIGRWLSPENWKRDVGCVILVGALAGAFLAIMMGYMFSTSEFQRNLPPEKIEGMEDLYTDYFFAAIWFGAWTLLGSALLYLGWKSPRKELEDRRLPPIIGR